MRARVRRPQFPRGEGEEDDSKARGRSYWKLIPSVLVGMLFGVAAGHTIMGPHLDTRGPVADTRGGPAISTGGNGRAKQRPQQGSTSGAPAQGQQPAPLPLSQASASSSSSEQQPIPFEANYSYPFTIPPHPSCPAHSGTFPKRNNARGGEKTVAYRDRSQRRWYEDGCDQWGLTGTWGDRDRKIYYGFMFADEAEILTVVLHEIYPVVDVIIILECTRTWQGEKKPLFFPKINQTSILRPYLDKIRYMPYDFDDDRTKNFVSRCMDEELAGPNWPPGMMQCRWIRQWGARDRLAAGAHDIRDHDAFIVADLDELLAREFVRALRYCDVFPEGAPEGTPPDACGRMGVFTYGHKYYFDCTVDRPHGHYHPNIGLGRCVKIYGTEELKRWWGEPKKYWPKPPGLLDTKMAGPGGWHMHSFLSTARVLWKWFSRSGRSAREHRGKWDSRWDDSDLKEIRSQRRACDEQDVFLMFDSEHCEPLPHIVREDPERWAHYIRYVPDADLPDPFQLEEWYHTRLEEKKDNDSSNASKVTVW
mmetsp:Transcript_7203/g.13806  ORF Transcript_7203/g.13806 Transcript_7203/m.13806 type:complete len:534 (+) Transcript_7203:36-1637(+)